MQTQMNKLNIKFLLLVSIFFNVYQLQADERNTDLNIQVAFIIITIIANRRGLSVAAAVGIVEKIISFLFLVPSSGQPPAFFC